MPQVHHVLRARKDNPVAKKGEPYYWWAFMVGGRGGPKHFSATPPKPSQLTQSPFLSTLYGIQEEIEALSADDGMVDAVADIAGRLNDLADETESNKENLPESFQNGSQGEQMQERADACRDAASELEAIDFDYVPDDKDDATDDEKADAEQEHWEQKLSEVNDVSIDAS